MRTVQTIAVVVWIVGLACAGDTRPAPARQRAAAPKAAPAKPVARQASPAMPDAQIEAAIRAKFAKSKINADKLQVHVQGGVATIEGRTDVIQHKGTATRMARTGGAVAVNNHVQVSDAARQKSAANLEQGRRRAQIKRGDARSDPRQPRPSR
ncbi:MAG: BON domain-containing protein [Acidobacteriia bacterium]|nr:BON domain-containing protein [Terriglobia bacterium]